MSSLDAYLDRACGRLGVNPAEAEDIREELRSHLDTLIDSYTEAGMRREEATTRAVADFGDARRLRSSLDRVHRGDSWWLTRLKGLGLGMLVGALIGVVAPLGGHLEFLAGLLPIPVGIDAAQFHIGLNAAAAGGIVGLLSAGGRGLLVGWSVGSLLWLGEYVAYWVGCVASGCVPKGGMLNTVLLAPLLGGVFGALVGAASTAILCAASRIRPQIQ